MNIQEYKNKRIKDIEILLKDMHFENIGCQDKEIITNLTSVASDFFNKPSLYRRRTEMLLSKISEYRTELIETKLEFISPIKELAIEEIETAIREFIEKVRHQIEAYKYDIIKIAFSHEILNDDINFEQLPEVKEKNWLSTGLNFIKIKIGETEFSLPRTGNEAENEDITINNLSIMILYIYILKSYIEDKKRKYEEFNNFIVTNFNVKDKEYMEIRKLQSIFLNEKNYEKFVKKYNSVSEEVVSIVIERDTKEEDQVITKK